MSKLKRKDIISDEALNSPQALKEAMNKLRLNIGNYSNALSKLSTDKVINQRWYSITDIFFALLAAIGVVSILTIAYKFFTL